MKHLTIFQSLYINALSTLELGNFCMCYLQITFNIILMINLRLEIMQNKDAIQVLRFKSIVNIYQQNQNSMV